MRNRAYGERMQDDHRQFWGPQTAQQSCLEGWQALPQALPPVGAAPQTELPHPAGHAPCEYLNGTSKPHELAAGSTILMVARLVSSNGCADAPSGS